MVTPEASEPHDTPPVGDAERDEQLPRVSVFDPANQRASAARTPLARIVKRLVWGLFFAGAAAIVVAILWQPPIGRKKQGETLHVIQRPTAPESPTESGPPKAAAPTSRHLAYAEILAQVESGIVRIESGGPQRHGNLGSGFVIDADGLIATNHHVIDEATQGQVRFKSGATYEIAGYAAVEPEHDLAILRIKDLPPGLVPLKLRAAGDPKQLAPVIAIGHPRGLDFSPFDGKVSRVLLTRELPLASQQFLARHLSASVDLRWIQHTAQLSQGNSGGPLLDEEGHVIGVNAWVDKESSFAYALHVRYLARLRDKLFAETAPLERFASHEARVNAAVARLSAERIERLFDECQALRWRPATAADYDTLQQFAWAITYPKFSGVLGGANLVDTALLEELAKATDRVEARLKQQKLDAFGQFTIVNEFASEQVNRPSAGLFFFGTVERIVEGSGSRGMLMKLAGFEQMLFLPLDGTLFTAPPGTHCLVLGVNAGGRTVKYGDNPLALVTAPVIVSRTILPLEE